jgi:hypothetical protein
METSNIKQYNAATLKHGSKKAAVLLANVNYSNTSFTKASDIYEQELKAAVNKGALVKVIAKWQMRDVHTERFWVHVTKTIVNKAGVKQHWGKVCTNTQVATSGDVIGPIEECNIAQIDWDFADQLKFAA